MSSPKRGLLIAVALLIAGSIGFFIGRLSGPTSGSAVGAIDSASLSQAGGPSSMKDGVNAQDAANAGRNARMAPEERVPWTRDRLKNAARQVLSSGSVFAGIPRAIRICATLEKEDFPMALQVAGSMAEDYDDHEVFQVFIMNRWAELDPRGFAEYLKDSSSKDPLHFMDETKDIILPVWLERNQLEAVQWAKSIADPEKRRELMESVVGVMAKLDPDGVVAFTRTHAPELLGEKGLPSVILDAWKSGAPEDAARRLVEAGDSSAVLHNVALRWAAKDRVAALKWAKELTDPEQRAQAMTAVFSHWAAKDFDGALAAVMESEEGAHGGRVLDAVLDSWPASDVASFQARAAGLPSGPARVRGYGVIANRLARDNPASAAEWLGKLPVSEEKDEALSKFAIAAVSQHGGAAMEWAETIDDPAKRRDTLRAALDQWFRDQPVAAFQWIVTPDEMTTAEKQALMKR